MLVDYLDYSSHHDHSLSLRNKTLLTIYKPFTLYVFIKVFNMKAKIRKLVIFTTSWSFQRAYSNIVHISILQLSNLSNNENKDMKNLSCIPYGYFWPLTNIKQMILLLSPYFPLKLRFCISYDLCWWIFHNCVSLTYFCE